MALCAAIGAQGADVEAERTDTSAVMLREVTVTAIKGGGSGPEAPAVSVTAITSGEIERLDIVNLKDAAAVAPNFYVPDYGSRMTSTVYMRGIGARIDQPAVGLNVDNVPILCKDNYDFDLVDIERIDIIRGPQSALYGPNTMAGVINITTLSPMRFSGVRLLAEYGRGNTWRAAASAYRRVRPEVGMSVGVSYYSSDGFWTNEYSGKKVDFQHQGAARWRTVWQPSGVPFTLDNVASATVSRQGGYPYASLVSGVISHNDTCFYRRTAVTDGLTMQWRPSATLTLSSITSFQYIDDNMTLDQDFLPISLFTLTQKRHEWALTEDLVARGRVGNWHWLGGLWAFGRRTSMQAPVTFLHDGIERLILGHRNELNPLYPVRWDDDSFVLGSNFKAPRWGGALYHNSEVDLGNWTLEAGLRLAYEHTALDYRSFSNTSYTTMQVNPDGTETPFEHTPVDIDDTGHLSRSSVELLPRIAATWRAGKVAMKASVARGYKAGGYNTQMFSDVLQQRIMAIMGMSMKYDVDEIIGYRPESSWNYELGAHMDCGAFSYDIAGFYIDCRNQQLTMFPEGTTTGRIMTNAGRTASYGVEAAMRGTLNRHWELNASYGYTHATFRRFNNGLHDFSGKRLPYAPEHTLFASATYSTAIPGHTDHSISLSVNTKGVGRIFWDEGNTVSQPFYALLGASAQWQWKNLAVQLWAENITNTRYDTFYFVTVGNAFTQRGRPWTAGATIRLNFPD